ncbi:MAG: polysaccharide deacetylase family protein [Pseudohongiella sp.]|nr:polysaccharide deacetylase family protein [Pseudohongiella sp.]
MQSDFRSLIKKIVGFSIRNIPHIADGFKQGLTVFVFHDVSDQPSRFASQYSLSVLLSTFRQQCLWIQDHYNVIHPADLLTSDPLPPQAAMISFDDGFLGTFENGLAILDELKLPSVVFLNMNAILNQDPIISATACYLANHVPQFRDFADSVHLKAPFHLTLTPSILRRFEDSYGQLDYDAIRNYQGTFADIRILQKWDGRPLVVFGNHLYEHWNAVALSIEEFQDQYLKNEAALSQLESYINLFAFTNGQPDLCFSKREISVLTKLGANRIFSSYGGVNLNPNDSFLLGRVGLSETDSDRDRLFFRIARASLNSRKMQ